VFSDEIGIRKPEARIFETALGHLGLAPSEVVHVGDDLVADVAGAKRLGMRAVWFDVGHDSEHAIHDPAAPEAARPDAAIHDHREFLEVLERWRP
jgi:FMN phosphatase YigB (HAD superfamily)